MTNKYYQALKRRLRKETCERYQNLSEEEKDRWQKKVQNRYENLPEEQKQKLLEYINKYYFAHKR